MDKISLFYFICPDMPDCREFALQLSVNISEMIAEKIKNLGITQPSMQILPFNHGGKFEYNSKQVIGKIDSNSPYQIIILNNVDYGDDQIKDLCIDIVQKFGHEKILYVYDNLNHRGLSTITHIADNFNDTNSLADKILLKIAARTMGEMWKSNPVSTAELASTPPN